MNSGPQYTAEQIPNVTRTHVVPSRTHSRSIKLDNGCMVNVIIQINNDVYRYEMIPYTSYT